MCQTRAENHTFLFFWMKLVFRLFQAYLGQFSCFWTLDGGSLGQEINLGQPHMHNMCPTRTENHTFLVFWITECFSILNTLSESVISFVCLTCVCMCRTRVRHMRPSPINFLTSRTPI